jgi:hypothetical protein
MTDNTQPVASELASPAPQAAQDDNFLPQPEQDGVEETEGDEQELSLDGDQEQEEQPLEPELVDVEYEGKPYKLPPELKDAILRQADYTRKTQEVAQVRKDAEARLAEAQATFNTSQEVLEARATALNLDNSLKQYESVNWAQLEAEDPIAAMSHWRQFQQLQQQRGQVGEYLTKTQTELSEKQAQATEARLRETAEFAQKELKGWTPELDAKITQFAVKDLGFSPEELRSSLNPGVYRTIYLAHIGHQALQKQATPQAQRPAPAAQPLTKVAARTSPPVGLDDRLSQAEWLARRNAQVGRG